MPNLTEHYKLKKQLPDEFYDVAVPNANMDTLDQLIYTAEQLRGYTKDETLKAATKARLGLKADAVPDDALSVGIPFLMNVGWKKIAAYETAGAYTWIAPDLFNGRPYKIGVFIINGGCAGSAQIRSSQSGSFNYTSAAGDTLFLSLMVTPGTSKNIVVGSKGVASAPITTYGSVSPASTPTASVFGGKTPTNLNYNSNEGEIFKYNNFFELKPAVFRGGSAQYWWSSSDGGHVAATQPDKLYPEGTYGGGVAVIEHRKTNPGTGHAYVAGNGIVPGSGGGSCILFIDGSENGVLLSGDSAKAGDGADGGVLIYAQGVDDV